MLSVSHPQRFSALCSLLSVNIHICESKCVFVCLFLPRKLGSLDPLVQSRLEVSGNERAHQSLSTQDSWELLSNDLSALVLG